MSKEASKTTNKLFISHLLGHKTIYNPGKVSINSKSNKVKIYDKDGELFDEVEDVEQVIIKEVDIEEENKKLTERNKD